MRRAGSKALRHTGLGKLTVEIARFKKTGNELGMGYSPACVPEYRLPGSEP
jgi:hypothetical protein